MSFHGPTEGHDASRATSVRRLVINDERHLNCTANGWICEGNTLIGPDAYAHALGLGSWSRSPQRRHAPYLWPPEILAWLG